MLRPSSLIECQDVQCNEGISEADAKLHRFGFRTAGRCHVGNRIQSTILDVM